jgi:hypothetical protein
MSDNYRDSLQMFTLSMGGKEGGKAFSVPSQGLGLYVTSDHCNKHHLVIYFQVH